MVLCRAKTLQILMELSLSIFSFRDQSLVSNLRTLQRCKWSFPFFLKVFIVSYFTLETILVIYFESVFVLGVRLRLRFFFPLISGCPIAQIAAVEMLSPQWNCFCNFSKNHLSISFFSFWKGQFIFCKLWFIALSKFHVYDIIFLLLYALQLGKEMATHSSTLAWEIPWMEEPDRLQSMGSQRVRHDRVTSLHSLRNLSLEKEMATHSNILAWRIPRTGEPGGLWSMGSQRVGYDWSDRARERYPRIQHAHRQKFSFHLYGNWPHSWSPLSISLTSSSTVFNLLYLCQISFNTLNPTGAIGSIKGAFKIIILKLLFRLEPVESDDNMSSKKKWPMCNWNNGIRAHLWSWISSLLILPLFKRKFAFFIFAHSVLPRLSVVLLWWNRNQN